MSKSSESANLNYIKDIMALFRITLCFLSSIAVFISAYCIYRWNLLVENNITSETTSFLNFFLNNPLLPLEGIIIGLIIPFLLIAGTHTTNDYFDFSSDKTNQRIDRPLVKGLLTTRAARNIAIFVYSLAFLLTLLLTIVFDISVLLVLVVAVFIFIGIFYNLGVKNVGIIGNIWVSVGYVAPFAIAAFFFGAASQWVFWNIIVLSCFIFFLALGREILKDIMDIKGDLATGKRSIPIVMGAKNAVWFSLIVYLIGIIFASSLVFSGFRDNLVFIIGFFFTVLLIIYTIIMMLQDPSPDKAITARKYTRWTLWWSTALIFFSSLFIN